MWILKMFSNQDKQIWTCASKSKKFQVYILNKCHLDNIYIYTIYFLLDKFYLSSDNLTYTISLRSVVQVFHPNLRILISVLIRNI